MAREAMAGEKVRVPGDLVAPIQLGAEPECKFRTIEKVGV
jgi:hypothetical protein